MGSSPKPRRSSSAPGTATAVRCSSRGLPASARPRSSTRAPIGVASDVTVLRAHGGQVERELSLGSSASCSSRSCALQPRPSGPAGWSSSRARSLAPRERALLRSTATRRLPRSGRRSRSACWRTASRSRSRSVAADGRHPRHPRSACARPSTDARRSALLLGCSGRDRGAPPAWPSPASRGRSAPCASRRVPLSNAACPSPASTYLRRALEESPGPIGGPSPPARLGNALARQGDPKAREAQTGARARSNPRARAQLLEASIDPPRRRRGGRRRRVRCCWAPCPTWRGTDPETVLLFTARLAMVHALKRRRPGHARFGSPAPRRRRRTPARYGTKASSGDEVARRRSSRARATTETAAGELAPRARGRV